MFIDSIHENNRIFCLKNSELFRLVASNRDLSVSWIEASNKGSRRFHNHGVRPWLTAPTSAFTFKTLCIGRHEIGTATQRSKGMGGLIGTVSQNKSSLVIIAAASQVKVKGLMPVSFSIVSKMTKHQGGGLLRDC